MVPPDRNSNPFSTCWNGPREVTYIPLPEASPRSLFTALSANAWRGQILGRHGAGKSTLLCALEPLAAEFGKKWKRIDLYSHECRKDLQLLRTPLDEDTLLVIDGYEQLDVMMRRLVRWRSRWNRSGLLVTAHTDVGLPMLLKLQPDEGTIRQVFRNLVRESPTPVDDSDFHNAFNACNGDIRKLFSDLYDLHERRVRQARQAHRPNRRWERRVVSVDDSQPLD
ncbi:hypothetical protein Pan181_17650 [Aeoliella mucimassa]|uniref:AAA+ ATPase domain-containing protein n=1 Tax=Aeoliella mucimassa TaxID=2527972 RepID=A0A518ALG8_9BACT|nr:hypothetical protein Pan181_17650 [Aeoliella mucimassa]